MAKQDFAACRICSEYVEQANLFDLFDVHTLIVTQIKEVLGVELINGTNLPPDICRQCYLDFKTAQEFRRRCIESNEYFESKTKNEIILFEDVLKEEEISRDETEYTVEVHVESKNNVNLDNEELTQNEDESGISRNTLTKHRIQKSRKTSKRKEFNEKEKPKAAIICDVCGNAFRRKHVFALHQRRHSNTKPYCCELCSSSFYTNSELKRHMRRHTGEKPYECQYCHRKFSDYGTHIKHERIHTNDRPFACNQCDKSFSCAFVLKNHMLTHTGERAFRCEVCDKSFGRSHNLTTHKKSIYHQKNFLKKTNKDKVTK